jgi:nucleotide-binding universal stress UspA family protein
MMPKRVCDLQGSFTDGFNQTVSEYKVIAVAIDNSYSAAKVLRRALLLAKSCSMLYIVHVLQTTLPYGEKSTITIDPSYYEILQKESMELFVTAEKNIENTDVNFETLLLEGDPAEEILKFISKKGVELMILGSKDKLGSTKNLGSVSSKIAVNAKCSVLIER